MMPARALALVATLTQLDVTATAVALPAIRDDLGFAVAGGAWVMDAYSLAFAGILLISGALADRYGRRWALLSGNAGFALASILCGIAWSGPALWGARALQGAAAAFVITGTLSSLSVMYPQPDERGRAFAIVGVASGAAMALGPTVGGVLATEVGWRWIFLVNLPVCAASAWIIPRLVTASRDPDGRPLDLPGMLLLTLALILPVQALLDAGGSLAWRAAGVGTGAMLATLFILRQRRQPRPILDLTLLAQRGAAGVGCVLLALSVGYWAVLVYLPSFLQASFGLSASRAGIAMLAATLPMLVLPPFGARLARGRGWGQAFALGLGAVAAGTAVIAAAATLSGSAGWWPAVGGMVIAGAGAGAINSQVSGALVAMAPAAQAGLASALATILRQGGFALGIALLGATSVAAADLSSYALPFGIAATAALAGALAAGILIQPRT